MQSALSKTTYSATGISNINVKPLSRRRSPRPSTSHVDTCQVGVKPEVDKKIKRKKPGKLFFITLTFEQPPSVAGLVREELVLNLSIADNNIVTYCCT